MIQIEASSKSLQLENWLPLPIESSYYYYFFFYENRFDFLNNAKKENGSSIQIYLRVYVSKAIAKIFISLIKPCLAKILATIFASLRTGLIVILQAHEATAFC